MRPARFGPADSDRIRKQKAKIKVDWAGVSYDRAMILPLEPGRSRAGAPDAVGFGLNTVDLLAVVGDYPLPDTKQPLDDLLERPGGQAATAMTACARLGWRARYVGRFGNDRYGDVARAALDRDGVDLTGCEQVDAPQAVSLILVDAAGRRTVLWRRADALNVRPEEVDAGVVTAGRVLLVDCHQTAAATRAATLARAAGVPTVIDVERVRPGIDALLEQIDVIITAQDFPEAYTGVQGVGAALSRLAERFRPALTCATLGVEGSLAVVDGREVRTPGFTVDVVDSTGAGDVFRGGFIAGWLASAPGARVDRVLTYANAVAALKCRALGARTAIPTRDEVEDLLRRTGR